MSGARLTPEQLEEVMRAFMLFDADSSGYVDGQELTMAMQALGIHTSNQQIQRLLDQYGGDNGLVDRGAFTRMMIPRLSERDSLDNLQKAFRIQNVEGNGRLTLADLQRVRTELGEGQSDEDLSALLLRMDKGGKGYVTEREYLAYTGRTFDLY